MKYKKLPIPSPITAGIGTVLGLSSGIVIVPFLIGIPYLIIVPILLMYVGICGWCTDYREYDCTYLYYPSFIEIGRNRRLNRVNNAIKKIDEAIRYYEYDSFDYNHLLQKNNELKEVRDEIYREEGNRKMLSATKYASKVIVKELE